MAGTTRSVKRQWSVFTRSDNAHEDALKAMYEEHNKVITDLETIRGAASDSVVAVTELITDHATFKTAADQVETLIEELHDDHAVLVTWITEVDADADDINDYLHYLNERDGVISGDHSFTAGTATTLTGAGRVTYRIGGIVYTSNVDTTITLEDNGDVTQSKYRAWRILIDKTGAVTTQDAGVAATGLNADNEEDALLCLSQRAITASTVEIGYLTLTDSDSLIALGTDNLDAAGVTANTFVVTGPRLGCGLNAALGGAGFAADAGVATWDSGTIDARVEGGDQSGTLFSRNLAQIGAITNQAMDDADTVGIAQYGGWLMVTNLAGTGVYALASDGIAGAVSAMVHASAAARNTALDNVQDRLPAIFAPLGRILLFNTSGANAWVAATDNWDHDTAVATVTNYTFGVFDRTALTGDVGRDAPAIPASIAAAILATITASKPASAPATLAASAPSATAINAAGDMTAASLSTPESGD